MVKTSASNSSSSSPSNLNNSTSNNVEVKYKGVRKRKWGKYVSEIRLPNSRERIWLGSYDTAEKAARAFDAALFCLRGRNASFNFRDDPPNIPDGQSLTPAEIHSVAQQYANSYSGGSSSAETQPNDDRFRAQAMELEDMSPSSNSEGAGPIDSIDWSFLDMLDSNRETNAGNVADFELFHEPGDMYMPPHFAPRVVGDDNDDDDDDGNSGNIPSSFLWSF